MHALAATTQEVHGDAVPFYRRPGTQAYRKNVAGFERRRPYHHSDAKKSNPGWFGSARRAFRKSVPVFAPMR
ncbi:hypothetical protein J2Z31_002202 [Sinorhizobium kostiense]|uniref:Uncharacterized protein n=1 Tax=Sinorhizobium kostiense TaxID=76747 RepID=A0ABS4R093_9HYPH|nr:hypothetical protein [Sinorhizobium kostiense]